MFSLGGGGGGQFDPLHQISATEAPTGIKIGTDIEEHVSLHNFFLPKHCILTKKGVWRPNVFLCIVLFC